MSALRELLRPVHGQNFLNADQLCRAIDDWAVKDKFTFRVPKRDAARLIFQCAEEGCEWKCRSSCPSVADDPWRLVVLNGEHTCSGRCGVTNHSSSSKKSWIDPVIKRHLNVTPDTRPQEIIDCIQELYAETISYKVAQQCRLRLLGRPADHSHVRGPRGRPRKGDVRRQTLSHKPIPIEERNRCGGCGETGHNKRRCSSQHA